MSVISRYVSKLLHLLEVRKINNDNNVVYLTFDDGPEPGITEYILNLLKKYDFQATFFCRGDNGEKYPLLLQSIRNGGNAVGNHTYNHIKAFNVKSSEYIMDVEKANSILHSTLFRPPWGVMTLPVFFQLNRKFRIIYWNRISGDTDMERFDKKCNLERLKKETKAGDIILFHCCQRHEKETREILPDYIEWLSSHGFLAKAIE